MGQVFNTRMYCCVISENALTYSIKGGNIGNAFEVVSDLGEIRVRGNLDYEEGPRVNVLKYCKFSNVCEGFIWRISRPSLNRKYKYPANIIHVPR